MRNGLSSNLYRYKKSSNYFFRIRRGFFRTSRYYVNKGYFVASLKTNCVHEAKWLSAFIRMAFEHDMGISKVMDYDIKLTAQEADAYNSEPPLGGTLMSLDPEFSSSFTEDVVLARIRQRFDILLAKGQSLIKLGITDFHQYEVKITQENINSIRVNNLKDTEVATRVMEGFIGEGVELPADTMAVTRLLQDCLSVNQQLLKAFVNLQDERVNLPDAAIPKHIGEVTDVFAFKSFQRELDQTIAAEAMFQSEEANSHYCLSHQYSLFRDEKVREIDGKSIEKYDHSMSILRAELGDNFDCRNFNKKVTQQIKARLLKQKKNENIVPASSSNKRGTQISAKTINMRLSNYRMFMAWFIANNDVHMSNPFKDVSVKANKRELIRRRPLHSSEIAKLLNYQWGHNSECRGYKGDALCFTKVALYTGMRLNEIASLRVDDVKQIDGVWVFDLTEKKLKSWNAQRTVPIAQYLIDIGIVYRALLLQKQKKTFLFDDLRKQRGSNEKKGYGEPVSRWFNRTALKHIGINKEQEKNKGYNVVFHCLRNTFINQLVSVGAQHHHIKRVVGHAQDDDVTLDSYADVSKISLSKLKSMIDENLTWQSMSL